MRSTLTLLICALASLPAWAQKPASYAYMTQHKMTCGDIAHSCQALIPAYARQNKTDSLRLVLQLWVDQCNDSERTMRMKILLNLKERTFYEEHYKDTLHGLLLAYRAAVEENQRKSKIHLTGKDSALFKNRNEFDAFTAEFAHDLSQQYDQYTLEFLLTEYYSRNFYTLRQMLERNQLPGTYLQQRYNDINERTYQQQSKRAVHAHAALLCEYWIPRKGAGVLGNHVGPGLQLGLRGERFSVDWTILLRFGNAHDEYQVYSQGAVKTTRHFFGEYFGAEMGHRLWHNQKNEVNLISGLGYDGVEAIERDSAAAVEEKKLKSLSINAGIGYRYTYSKKGNYVGLQTTVNAVNYFNKDGTDLNGHTVSMRLVWGRIRTYYSRRHYNSRL